MKLSHVTVAVAILFVCACGGKQSIASKSAAAYAEAVRKGIPITGEGHGGHSASAADHGDANGGPMPGMSGSEMKSMNHTEMPGMSHGSMAGMDHSDMTAMNHSQMTGMDHSKMAGMDHSKMSAMDHSKMQGMDHSKMAAMDHSDMQGMDHSSMAGMANMSGMHHTAPLAPPVPPAPLSSSGIAALSPSSTLKTDPFDAPSPSALNEASKPQP